MYFNNITSWEVAKKLWYTIHAVDNYYNSHATTYYTNDWTDRKRCTTCKVYRKTDEYGVLITKRFRSSCNICIRQIARNKYRYRKNLWKESYSNISWEKHRWKYNVQRSIKAKIKRILLKNKKWKM